MGVFHAVPYSTVHKRGRASAAVYIIMSMVYPRTIGHYHVNLLSWEGCTVGMENWPILSLHFSLHFKREKNSCGFLFEIEKMHLFSSLASISFNSIRKCTGTFLDRLWKAFKSIACVHTDPCHAAVATKTWSKRLLKSYWFWIILYVWQLTMALGTKTQLKGCVSVVKPVFKFFLS
jgi:hypothetical protein